MTDRRLPSGPFVACLLLLNCQLATSVQGQQAGLPVQLAQAKSAATPLQDDATLHAVAAVGRSVLWTAGDHGTVFRSVDAGTTWEFITVPSQFHDCSFQALCFLTDRVGWIAGGRLHPATGQPVGVVLSTTDGGASWSEVGNGSLPFVHQLAFFDDQVGIIAAEPTSLATSGILTTSDGGLTWQGIASAQRAHWQAAHFTGPASGLLVGPRGTRGVLHQGQLQLSADANGLKGFHALSINARGEGWAAGDGGLLLYTDTSGVSWTQPRTPLPRQHQDYLELTALSHVGSHVWATGTPGGVIWHSPDVGETWTAQQTGNSAPLRALKFLDAEHGVAVGALGRILVTGDGGRTWNAVRGGDRRVALLTIHGTPQQLPGMLLARYSLEEGYRAATTVLTRRDLGPDGRAHGDDSLRLTQSLPRSGVNAAEIDWRLPLSIPELEISPRQLSQEWSLLTDSRLADIVLNHLSARIRMWRPDVIVINEPQPDDAVAALVREAVQRARELAADPAAYPAQQQCGLAPWTVRKVYAQCPPDGTGTIRLDPYLVMPRSEKTLVEAARLTGLGEGVQSSPVADEQYNLLEAAEEIDPAQAAQSMFGDLKLSPGGDARRLLPNPNAEVVDELVRQAQQQRMVSGLAARMVEHPETAPALLAQLKELVAPLTPEQAARQLARIALEHRRQGQLDLAEETYAELLEHYPGEDAAHEARLWLLRQWTSQEVNWQRLNSMRATQSQVTVDAQILRASWEEGVRLLQQAETETARQQGIDGLQSPLQSANSPLQLQVTGRGQTANQSALRLVQWQEMAQLTFDRAAKDNPELWNQPDVQFAYAALMRKRARHKKADEIYDRYLQNISDDPWHLAAKGEVWLLHRGAISPKPVMNCRMATVPPLLDGVLSDPCWGQAGEVKLSAHGEQSLETFVGAEPGEKSQEIPVLGPKTIVMFSYDARFLYVAASVPRLPDAKPDPPAYSGRTHDADLHGYDRIELSIDVDRDYGTFYTFAVDQRGCTREACWENNGFNPHWYVAAAGDDRTWSIEAAIPLEALVPKSPSGEAWAVGISRIVPGIAHETWTASGATIPEPARFGLVQFRP